MNVPGGISSWNVFQGENPLDAIQDLFVSRYLSVAGFVILLYDTLLLFPDELHFLRKSQTSFKWAFIINKYIVIVSLTFIIIATSGLGGLTLSDRFCKGTLAFATFLGSPSIALVSALAILRITALSSLRQYVYVLIGVCIIIGLASLGTVLFTLVKIASTIQYVPQFGGMCIVGGNTRDVAVSIVLPLALDLSVLFVTLKYALTRPNLTWYTLQDMLLYDGFSHFMIVFCCRLACLVIVVRARPTLLLAGVIFAWPFISAVLSRLLVTLRSRAKRQAQLRHIQQQHPTIQQQNESGETNPEGCSEEDYDMVMEMDPGPRSFDTEESRFGIKEAGYGNHHEGKYKPRQGDERTLAEDSDLERIRTDTASESTPRSGYMPMGPEAEGMKAPDAIRPGSPMIMEMQPLSFSTPSNVGNPSFKST